MTEWNVRQCASDNPIHPGHLTSHMCETVCVCVCVCMCASMVMRESAREIVNGGDR